MTDEIIEEEQEKKGFFSWLASKFGGKKEEGEEPEAPQYKRRLFDGRIEKYLDQNLDSYISEYGIVTELDLQGYEQRYQTMTGRVKTLKEFMLDSDAVLGQMEKEMELIGKGAKKAKK